MSAGDHGLIGRTHEYEQAAAALLDGSGLVVTGEAGAGKTALVTAALGELPVRAGQCFRSLAWTPGAPLQQAIGRAVPPGDASWAAQAIVTACHGAVLRLDDLQWADPATIEVLALLPPSLRLAATVRSGDPGSARALEVLAERGLVRIDLGPLDLDDAVALAVQCVPRLRDTDARRLAERCGGNPLLIQELGADPEPNAGLRRSVMSRLHRLGAPAWQGFAMLSIADEPLPAAWLPDVKALSAAGLVVDTGGGQVLPRHPLLAEAVNRDLTDGDADRRAGAAFAVAERAERAGKLPLAARCRAVAGDMARATELALRAVAATDRPGERAALLYLAASAADGERAASLLTDAVETLVTAGDYDQAARLIETSAGFDDAHWWGLVGRVRWQLGDDDAAMDAFESGLALATPGTRDAVLLLAEQARATMLGLGESERALTMAQAAHAAAEEAGVEQARSLAVLGTVEHFADDDPRVCVPHLETAIELAERDGDLMVEFTTANNLIAVLESLGQASRSIELARHFADRAEHLRMRRWQVQMTAMAHNSLLHQGRYDDVLAEIPVLLTEAVDGRTRDQLLVTLGIALIDVGATDEAIERVDSALPLSSADYYSRGSLLWVRAEAHLWGGDVAEGLVDATAALELTTPGPRELFPLVTIAHCRLRAGEPASSDAVPDTGGLPIMAGAPPELEGLAALSGGDRASAAALFTTAAAGWAGQHRRGELRCRWLAADCTENDDEARTRLLELEQELSDLGWLPLLNQVRRSLRARGVRSAAPRGRVGDLTAREREVLDLVAQGLSTEAVARRLGLSPATVAAQIASARARLGATHRWQASSAG